MWRHNRSDNEVQLVFIRLINSWNAERSFEVELVRNDEQVFNETYYDVPAYGSDRERTGDQNPSTHLLESTWEEGPATFELRGRFVDQEDDNWQTVSPADADGEYVGIDLQFWEQQILGGFYTFETESERESAREFIETELERQSNRDRYGRAPD
ncbi:hypothetical protein SAMN04515672_2502 [Natronorubrum texcoconense]|uniref:Uncharacterized protein n=1 Tax=Natronorubrum texcoconense TaxID=1095776 RepID=A0A1G8ZXW0_9EURY|nr:hypothetical protein SAMN04515672_2502 [Natronorubrum texcoconense]